MAEEDPIGQIEGLPKQIASTLLELYKVIRDRKQQEMQQAMAQANQERLQAQQQQFMELQNQRLLDAMQHMGVKVDGEQVKSGLTRMERLAEDELSTQKKIGEIDTQIAEIDKEQRSLMLPEDTQGLNERLTDVGQRQKESDELYLKELRELNDSPTLSSEDLKENLEKLNAQKKEIDKGFNMERDAIKSKMAELAPVDLNKVKTDLADLDKAQKLSDDGFKQKADDLMKKPGMDPDTLFKEMGKLDAQKLEADKGFAEKRAGLEKQQKPRTALTQDQRNEKIKTLHEKKAGLMKEKGGLQEKMKGIETEKTGLLQGKGMGIEGMGQGQQVGQGMGQKPGGQKLAGNMMGNGSQGNAVMFGGYDVGKKALANPKSVAASIFKELKEGGQKLGPGLKQTVSTGRGIKH